MSLLIYIDKNISSMIKYPLMWGSLETIEMLFLTYMEFREQIINGNRDIKKEWKRFFHLTYPDNRPFYLNTILKERGDKEDKMVEIMNGFYQKLNN